ncbi:hypothetical protein R1flu_011041 [Riccia fluitans]|uniref:Uncharacterized protein n=1 Tax=Riccia fluitans TaxID=41844 RepID=A0ABD1Z6P9_9MARC
MFAVVSVFDRPERMSLQSPYAPRSGVVVGRSLAGYYALGILRSLGCRTLGAWLPFYGVAPAYEIRNESGFVVGVGGGRKTGLVRGQRVCEILILRNSITERSTAGSRLNWLGLGRTDPHRMPIAGLWDWMGNRRSGCSDCQPSALRLMLSHLLVRLGSFVNFALRGSGHLGLGNLYSGRVPSKELTLQPLSSAGHTQNGSGYSLLVTRLTPLGMPRGEDGLTEVGTLPRPLTHS